MNNIKIVFFNIETINEEALKSKLTLNPSYKSYISIKPGLFLVNYLGSAQELYNAISSITLENNILIYDLSDSPNAYWGYMNKAIWDWIKVNSSE